MSFEENLDKNRRFDSDFERKIVCGIFKKFKKKYPNIFKIGIGEFEVKQGFEVKQNLKDTFFLEFLNNWLLVNFVFFDGKKLINFIKDFIILDDSEKKFLDNILNFVCGYFCVLNVKLDFIILEDILTKKKYEVENFGFEEDLKEKDLIKVKLVKNFRDNFYFFSQIKKKNFEQSQIFNTLDIYLEK